MPSNWPAAGRGHSWPSAGCGTSAPSFRTKSCSGSSSPSTLARQPTTSSAGGSPGAWRGSFSTAQLAPIEEGNSQAGWAAAALRRSQVAPNSVSVSGCSTFSSRGKTERSSNCMCTREKWTAASRWGAAQATTSKSSLCLGVLVVFSSDRLTRDYTDFTDVVLPRFLPVPSVSRAPGTFLQSVVSVLCGLVAAWPRWDISRLPHRKPQPGGHQHEEGQPGAVIARPAAAATPGSRRTMSAPSSARAWSAVPASRKAR